MTKEYFIELAEYNIWANDIVSSMLEKINEDQWSQKITSSFNSIHETTLHVISAENAWLQRFKKTPVEWLQLSYKGSKDEHIRLWKKISAGLKDFITSFDENNLPLKLDYKRLNGEEKSTPFYIMFAHVFNHSTYHRGQLITMLRQLGFTKIKSTDFVGFYKNN